MLVVARLDDQVSSVGLTEEVTETTGANSPSRRTTGPVDRRANVAPRCSNLARRGGALAGPLPGRADLVLETDPPERSSVVVAEFLRGQAVLLAAFDRPRSVG